MREYRQKRALVTGATSGIGRALTIELLRQGYEVLAVSSSKERCEELQKRVHSGSLSTYVCDVAKLEDVQKVSQMLRAKKIVPTLFFLNAGIAGESAIEPIDSLDIDTHTKIFSVNYYGVLHFIKEWLKPCAEQGGATFIASGSINAIFAPPGGCAYAASKAAIAKAFDGLRLVHAHQGHKFVHLFCGPVATQGLVGKVPLAWSAEKMARYMIKKAEKGGSRYYPSWIYAFLAIILNRLPGSWTLAMLRWLS